MRWRRAICYKQIFRKKTSIFLFQVTAQTHFLGILETIDLFALLALFALSIFVFSSINNSHIYLSRFKCKNFWRFQAVRIDLLWHYYGNNIAITVDNICRTYFLLPQISIHCRISTKRNDSERHVTFLNQPR